MRQPVAYLWRSSVTPNEQTELPSNGRPSWQLQEAQVRELAARHGDEDLLVLPDWEDSEQDDRPDRLAGYSRLREMVENGEVSAIYSYSLSYLAGDLSEYHALAELCRERGVPMRSCDEGEPEDSSPTARLIMSMLAAVTQMESELALISDDRGLHVRSPLAPTQAKLARSSEDQADESTGVADELAEMICRMGGLDRSTIDRGAKFADLGLDSLFLTRFASQIRKQLGVRVKLAEIFEETSTIESLAKRIERKIATGSIAGPATASMDPRPSVEPSDGHLREAIPPLPPASLSSHAAPSSDDVVALIGQQLRVMNQQLDLLASHAGAATEEPATNASVTDAVRSTLATR